MIFKSFMHQAIKLLLCIIFIASSIFSFEQNNSTSCKQIEDVIDNGCRYMQFVFVDSKGNYTSGYLESYDDPSKGSLFCCINPIFFVSKTNLQMQQLQKFHVASITRMKQQAILRSPVTQRQQVDQLFLQGRITPEQAKAYYQQIAYAQLIAQAQKQAKKIRKEYCKKSSYIPLQKIEMEYELHNYVVNSVDSKDSLFEKIMHERTKAYELSLKHQISKTKQYKMNT